MNLAPIPLPEGNANHQAWDAGNGYTLMRWNIHAGGRPQSLYQLLDSRYALVSEHRTKEDAHAAVAALPRNGNGSAPVPAAPAPTDAPKPLARLQDLIARYVVLSDDQRLIVALWIVHTHLVQYFETTPYLAVTSPTKQCGKSQLLKLLKYLTPRSWLAVLPSEAVVYRQIHAVMPTLLLDETDTIFSPRTADKHEGLRAILNAGYSKGAAVPRCIGNSSTPQDFRVFCAKVLAGIGTLPDTVADRSVPIRLQKKKRSEHIERFREPQVAVEAQPYYENIVRWAEENGPALAAARPALPEELSDRMQDACEPLIAIAEKLDCGDEARAALVRLLTAERADSTEEASLKMLRDIRTIFDAQPDTTTGLPTSAILMQLNADGWSDWHGRGMNARDLAWFLGHYEIKAQTVRTGTGPGDTARGYRRDAFAEAWARYLAPAEADEEAEA